MCIIMLNKTSLPVNWQLINLEAVISPRKEKIHPNEIKGELYIGLEHVISNNLNITNFGSSEGLKSTKSVFYSGDILYGKLRPYLNKVVLADRKGICSTDIIVFQVKKDLILPKYMANILRNKAFLIYATTKMSGANLPRVSWQKLKKFKISLPPLETQKKIVEILENAEKLNEWRAAADELADEYLKSVFLEIFGDPKSNPNGWKYANFSEIMIGTPQNGLYKHSAYYTKDNSGVPILRIDSFYDGKLKKLNNLKRLNCTNEELERFKLENENIVINRVNSIEYLGKCALIENLLEPTVYESNMMQIKIDKSIINPVYLTKFLCTNFVYNQIVNKAKKAVNQASINQKDVKSLKILIPPIELQNQFANIIQQVETLKSYQSQSKQQIDNLFNTLMQKAFKGELVC